MSLGAEARTTVCSFINTEEKKTHKQKSTFNTPLTLLSLKYTVSVYLRLVPFANLLNLPFQIQLEHIISPIKL